MTTEEKEMGAEAAEFALGHYCSYAEESRAVMTPGRREAVLLMRDLMILCRQWGADECVEEARAMAQE